ncbi:MAG TPA: 4-(cytidine 5'-diphospho)-2-C-methyl-D-erythritol kinase [Candidatus Acidoferrales bacterium]|nr:4-(cytidine 5'-diphospho)-2-C-methyl-D-erythritol kinase [Candidatus Acidoferrales bacterium]
MNSLRLPAFAKINECLCVLGRRSDGYHELRTIFQTIGLHDVLEFSLLRARAVHLECDDPALPTGRHNLVWRAAAAARRALGLRRGVLVRLEKRVPVGRGLGGGSSDAAVALLGVERLAGRSLDPSLRLRIAAALGSDVPFFLFGGRALGIGRGEEIYPLPPAPKRTILVVSPSGIAVSTRDAYGWLRAPALTTRPSARKLDSFCALCWSGQGASLENDFEAAVFRRHPRLARIRRALLRHGAAGAALAGSGSAVFGVFPSPAHARRAATQFPDDQIFITETVSGLEYRRALRGA